MEAKTIHRMLEMDGKSEEGIRYHRDENNLLDEDVIIVDEASMIDLFLMDISPKSPGHEISILPSTFLT